MLDYLSWFFRPRNSYEPERVDYNALNILSEYQCFNLEFCKNELNLNNYQCANVMDLFWQLLEFDPDEKTVEKDIDEDGRESQLHKQEDEIAYHDIVNPDEEEFKKLLKQKYELFRKLLASVIEHSEYNARITVEHARRVAKYAQETFFKHLRLYDFVLKNTKLSEVKRIIIPIAEPKCGEELSKAITLFDSAQEQQRALLNSGGDGS